MSCVTVGRKYRPFPFFFFYKLTNIEHSGARKCHSSRIKVRTFYSGLFQCSACVAAPLHTLKLFCSEFTVNQFAGGHFPAGYFMLKHSQRICISSDVNVLYHFGKRKSMATNNILFKKISFTWAANGVPGSWGYIPSGFALSMGNHKGRLNNSNYRSRRMLSSFCSLVRPRALQKC